MSEYEVKEGAIYRLKDEKKVADIVDGEAKPTAPAYYKIKEELDNLVSEPAKDESSQSPDNDQASDLAEDQPSAEEVAEEVAKEIEKKNKEIIQDKKKEISNRESVWCERLENAYKERKSWADVMDEARSIFGGKFVEFGGLPEMPLAPSDLFDLTGCPEGDPQIGDESPEVVKWWVENYPREAKRRYADRDLEVYKELTK